MGVNPTITWNAAYISGTNKIQLRQKFTLTVHDTIDIKLIEPTYIHREKSILIQELSRALNIATDYAMLDEYRMEHISYDIFRLQRLNLKAICIMK